MSETLGKISGSMLKDNLLRDGIDLVFENDFGDNLLYLDVNSQRIGVKTDGIPSELFINDSGRTTNLIVDNLITITNQTQISSSISAVVTLTDDIELSAASKVVNISGIDIGDFRLDANKFAITTPDINLELLPSNKILINSFSLVTKELYIKENLSVDSNLIFGLGPETTVSFSTDLDTNLIPTVTSTYSLGNPDSKWKELHTLFVNGQSIATDDLSTLTVENVARRQGNIWYVATFGIDVNLGNHQNSPFSRVEEALARAMSGDTVFIYPGTYLENFPLTVPTGVTVKGFGIRSVKVVPTDDTKDQDAFLLNGETMVSDLTVADFFYNSTTDTGYGFRFAPNFKVTARSPYIQNVTVLTSGSNKTVDDPLGFDSGDAGRGALIDGSAALSTTNEASMLFHSVTMIVPNSIGVYMTNGVRVEWLNSFTYFADKGLYATKGIGRFDKDGSSIRFGGEIRSIGSANIYGNIGAEADGEGTLMYLINHNFAYIGTGADSSNDPTLVIQTNETVELNQGKIYYQSLDHKGTFRVGDVFNVDLETGLISIDGVGVGLGGVLSFDFVENGNRTFINSAKIEANNIKIEENTISSLSGPINVRAQNNEINLNKDIVAEKNVSIAGNFGIDGQLIIGNEVIDTIQVDAKFGTGIIPNQDAVFNIGTESEKWNIVNVNSLGLDDILVDDNRITTRNSNSNLELAASGTGLIYIPGNDIEIDQSLYVNGLTDIDDLFLTGNLDHVGNTIRIGNSQITGDITVNGSINISSDLEFENIAIVKNRITTLNSNSNLDLNAAGSGKIYVPTNNVLIDQELTVVNDTLTSTISNTFTITSDRFYNYDILITENYITTTNSNSNLEFYANSQGGVFLEELKFTDNRLTTERDNLNIVIKPGTLKNLIINDVKAFRLPRGTQENRTVGETGDLRFNLEDNKFEGWSSARVTLGEQSSDDRKTSVRAHPTDKFIGFIANNVATMEVVASGFRLNGLTNNDALFFNNNGISSLVENQDILINPSSENTFINDIRIFQNQFENQNEFTPLTLAVSGDGHVKFNSTTGLRIPSGDDSNRLLNPELGTIRFNTADDSAEIFNGSSWQGLLGESETATEEQIQELNEFWAIVLG